MSDKVICGRCNGSGGYDALVSQHDDKLIHVTCDECDGKGFICRMTDEEEENYWFDYW